MNNCNSKILFNRKQKKRIKIHIRNWRCLKKIRFLQEWNFLVQKEKFKKSIFNNRRQTLKFFNNNVLNNFIKIKITIKL